LRLEDGILLWEAEVLLRESGHLLLHTLHIKVLQALARRGYLRMHIRGSIETCELRLQRRRGTECALLRVLRCRGRSLRGRRNEASGILLLRCWWS
jgi:hypothetical protein